MNDFVKFNNAFEKTWMEFLGYRWTTMKAALNLFHQRGGETIVETGCIRQMDDRGAGYSTRVFAEYIRDWRAGAKLFTVDNTQVHLDIAKGLCHDVPAGIIDFTCADSVEYLTAFTGEINLLYLDSYDYPIVEIARIYEGEFGDVCQRMLDEGDDKVLAAHPVFLPPQRHCLNELIAAWPKLTNDAIILLDDNRLPGGGKSRLAKEHLEAEGATCIFDCGQSLWVRS